MKILVYSDTHISERHGLLGRNHRTESGARKSIDDALATFAWMAEVAQDRGVDLILNGGDLFDRSRPTPAEYTAAITGIGRLAEIAPHYTIVGNHDSSGGAGEDATDVLDAARVGGSAVIDRPARTQIGGSVFYFLPYPNRGDVVAQAESSWGITAEQKNADISGGLNAIVAAMASRAIDDRASGLKTVLLSHITWRGAKFNDFQTAPLADIQVSLEHLDAFDWVLGGHIHKHQRIGPHPRAWYVPPQDRWTFGDEGDFRGVAVVDLEAEEIEWVENPGARVFITLTTSQILQGRHRLNESPGRPFVRVVGEVDTIEEYDAVQAALGDLGVVAAGIRNDAVIARQREEVSGVDPAGGIEEIFGAFVAARPDEIPEGRRDDVLALAQELVASMA